MMPLPKHFWWQRVKYLTVEESSWGDSQRIRRQEANMRLWVSAGNSHLSSWSWRIKSHPFLIAQSLCRLQRLLTNIDRNLKLRRVGYIEFSSTYFSFYFSIGWTSVGAHEREREITWYYGLWHQRSSFKTTECLLYHVSLCWTFWSHHLCFIASRPWPHFSFKLSS